MRYAFFLLLTLTTTAFAQKKILDHTVYNDWKRIGEIRISADGKFSAYTIRPHRGDGYLYIVNNETGRKDSIHRGINPVFAGDNSFLAFKITPGFDTLRKNELNKVKKEKWPKDSLGVYSLQTGNLTKYDKLRSFYVSPASGWLSYLQDGNRLPAVKEKKRWFRKKKKPVQEIESEGNILTVLYPSLVTGEIAVRQQPEKIKDVKHVYVPERGDYFAYVLHQKKEKADSFEIRSDNPGKGMTPWSIPQKFNAIGDITFNRGGDQIVFTASTDTSKTKNYELFYADLANRTFRKLVDSLHVSLPEGLRVSQNTSPYFSGNGQRIFFGIAKKQQPDPKDTLLENEKARLDVWSWQDERLQSQQLVDKDDDEKETRLCVYELNGTGFTVLSSDTLKLRVSDKLSADQALAYSIKPYEKTYNWEYPNKRDYYLVDLRTGKPELLMKEAMYDALLSPSGKYFAYFDGKTREMYLKTAQEGIQGRSSCITCLSKEEWLEDVNGMPHTPSPVGVLGWTRNEELILQSKYDLFMYDPVAGRLYDLTQGQGKKQKIRYSLQEWERDSVYIDFTNTYVTGFFEKDKSVSLYKPALSVEKTEGGNGLSKRLLLAEQFHSPHYYQGFLKAKKADHYLFQRANVAEYPDAYLSNWSTNASPQRISNTNPQQSEYNWATVELISWKSYDGIPLEGLLYKPENYDSTQKYPLLVYYYELYSDELYLHSTPRPTASIIFPTEYASAGYFVLIPDIRYQTGHPAKSAYNCIMSGTDYVLRKYKSVDSTHMGLQGQSWGGYQTAQLITMTTRYRAAMAGAPVSNMFSAYGGIRWGSGINRQFQYERTQSRIGKTIWEAPELYVENSPLFHLPKVQTPLLIMSNDADGAVPWYQGLELFTGLKRLNKPVWLLNYNGDDHNLMKNANRIDLSIRMRQFFDHYLQGKPAPKWLSDGVPAVDKGKNYGLGY